MAVLGPPSARVETTAGVAVNGGKLRVYNVNTTTLSSLYSDEALSTPLTNPVVADSNGFLPMIFVAEGTYDIAYLTAANVLIAGQSYNDWPTYTEGSAGSFERTLSGARVEIDGGDIGDGNIGVRLQAGNPDPDDTGGYLRLGGWDGSQGDGLVVDFETADFAEKSLQEDGSRVSRFLSFESQSLSAASTIDPSLINDPAGTRRWKFTFYDFSHSASTYIAVRLSYDGGATYKSGANDYGYTANAATATNATEMRITGTSTSSANNAWVIEIEVMTPDSGNGTTKIWGRIAGQDNAGTTNPEITQFSGVGRGNYGRATHLRLFAGSGTVTAKFVAEEHRGFGE